MDDANDASIIAIIDQKLNIQQYMGQLLDKKILNANKLFTIPLLSMAHQTAVPYDILEQILCVVADSLVPEVTDFQYCPPVPHFNDPILDHLLVLPEHMGGILEISGQAGSGKSNIVYQLAVNERLRDMARPVVLISTEGRVPTQRLHQIANGADSPFSSDDILAGIQISEADTVDQLRDIVHNSLPAIFFDETARPPSLVIIYSIAALFRIEYDANSAPERSKILFNITTTLKWISRTHNALIVATNQATANISAFSTNPEDWLPALGLSWANCVNVRVRVAKTGLRHEIGVSTIRGERFDGGPRLVPIRTMYVEISPIRQDVKGQFYIDNCGIHGL
jgi:RecA/RadA recombinase